MSTDITVIFVDAGEGASDFGFIKKIGEVQRAGGDGAESIDSQMVDNVESFLVLIDIPAVLLEML